MIQITNNFDLLFDYSFKDYCKPEDIVFFDIETTGFAAEVSSLYLIGCANFQNCSWHLTQWFADDYNSEEDLLHSFFKYITNFQVILHYNGAAFDIPYILKKCKKYNLEYNFNHLTSLDIYKKILPYKKILKLPNLKQRSIEQFLDVEREDPFHGGELIKVYGDYLKYRFSRSQKQQKLLDILLLHNEEDIKGLIQICSILSYADLIEQDYFIEKSNIQNDHYVILIRLSHPLKKRINFGNQDIYVSAFGDVATIKIRLYKDELKFFFDNYKDYYYLKEEDIAIHKSVAFYVDKNYRTKAKAANCYSKKTGYFIPQYQEIITPYFRIDYHDPVSYIEVTEDFNQNKSDVNRYTKHILMAALKLMN